jgi:Zn-dependent peptidase ImmA (M78 family)
VIHLLEAHGVRVFSLPDLGKEVDGFSVWQGPTPHVFLDTSKSAERSRMDAAHELGHLVLHAHGGPQGRVAEDEANAFGSAFLMPAPTVLAEVPFGATLKQIVRAKKKWKVSALNLTKRCHVLGLLTDWQYRSICVELTRRGKKNEPQPMKERETSQVLEKVFRALKTEGVTKAEVAKELAIPVDELNSSIFGLLTLQAIEGEASDESDGGVSDQEADARRRTMRIVP